MKRLQRAAVFAELTEKLSEYGSWCGETHIQKATYILQELMDVPMAFEFTLYKHGPFSFDLRDELTEMRADGLIKLVPRPYPYGPTLLPSKNNKNLRRRFPKTLKKYKNAIEFVAEKLGAKGVVELEKLSTALLVTRELGDKVSSDDRAERIRELKPHLTAVDASFAVEEIDDLIEEAST
jgi:uncharacterized protein YwgA